MLTTKLYLLGSHSQRPLAHTRASRANLGATNDDRGFSHHAGSGLGHMGSTNNTVEQCHGSWISGPREPSYI